MRNELMVALGIGRGGIFVLTVFSIFVNLLMLTGPLFMLQVYDRVLSSRSEATLTALLVLVIALYALMGVLDYARGRVAARIGARFQSRLDPRVFTLQLQRGAAADGSPASALRDLESVQKFMSAPSLFAVFDLPWTPIFIGAIYIFHPWMGWYSIAGAALLFSITMANQLLTREVVRTANRAAMASDAFADNIRNNSETISGLGMQDAAMARWRRLRNESLYSQITSADRTGGFASVSKSMRFLLQSGILALGAYLVLQNELSAGAMIAGSILLGRALAPVDQAISGWPLLQRAAQGWSSLAELLGSTPPPEPKTVLPRPKAHLLIEQLSVVPPKARAPTLRMLNFELLPGQALGVIGASGSGKTTLARTMTGMWLPASGTIRLGGASLDQYSEGDLGRYIGYLPQDVILFGATIAENIARLAEAPDDAEVVKAARIAGAHEMILQLPQGYDTPVASGATMLSGGQKQRVGLARALYGGPEILILDEPNSNLDNVGQQALNAAIRQMKEAGKSVIIMAHRPAAIAECDTILVLEGGTRKAFGPRDEVLKSQVKNHAQIASSFRSEAQS
ncbi:MAG: type I secretion system permease/ATPase [Pseudomonadota bacterium]